MACEWLGASHSPPSSTTSSVATLFIPLTTSMLSARPPTLFVASSTWNDMRSAEWASSRSLCFESAHAATRPV
eukprot:1949869-Prymnesium_polylepis.1